MDLARDSASHTQTMLAMGWFYVCGRYTGLVTAYEFHGTDDGSGLGELELGVHTFDDLGIDG